MKTNYMNSRQKFFAITLIIATVISLAWIKPSKAEVTLDKTDRTDKHTATAMLHEQMQEVMDQDSLRQTTPADTSKKKRKKTLTIIGKSAQDSTLKAVYNININSNTDSTLSVTINNALKPMGAIFVKIDSLSKCISTNTANQVNTTRKRIDLNLAQQAVVIKNQNTAMQNQKAIKMNQGKFKKIQDLSVKDQEKLKVFQKEVTDITKRMQIELSPIQKIKMEELAKNLKENLYSQEQMAVFSKMGADLAAATLKFHNFTEVGNSGNGTIIIKTGENSSTGNNSSALQDQEISQSKEYKQLKKKFDADVEALKEKKSQKNKK